MTTFAVLKSDVADWLLRDDLTTVIPSFVRNAEAAIRRDIRVSNQETSASITVTNGTGSLPDGFIEAYRVTVDSTTYWHLNYLTPSYMYSSEIYNETGTAEAYTIEGSNIIIRPQASATVLMGYVKAFDALSDDTDTNWLLTNAYDVYLYGTLVQAAPYIKDDARLPMWQQMYANAVAATNKTSKFGRASGAPLRTFGTIPI